MYLVCYREVIRYRTDELIEAMQQALLGYECTVFKRQPDNTFKQIWPVT